MALSGSNGVFHSKEHICTADSRQTSKNQDKISSTYLKIINL
ncbi:hypothetical protein Gotur_020310 [Gossypium turneri]